MTSATRPSAGQTADQEQRSAGPGPETPDPESRVDPPAALAGPLQPTEQTRLTAAGPRSVVGQSRRPTHCRAAPARPAQAKADDFGAYPFPVAPAYPMASSDLIEKWTRYVQ